MKCVAIAVDLVTARGAVGGSGVVGRVEGAAAEGGAVRVGDVVDVVNKEDGDKVLGNGAVSSVDAGKRAPGSSAMPGGGAAIERSGA